MSSSLFLNPGGYFFGQLEGELTTLLGSCVSLCAWHPEKKLLMVSHVVLPERPPDQLLKDTRYGDVVMQCILADVYRHRTHISDYNLALFGGSTTIYKSSDYAGCIGAKNVRYMHYAVETVMKCQIKNEDTGGIQHRRLQVDGINGRFRVTFLNKKTESDKV